MSIGVSEDSAKLDAIQIYNAYAYIMLNTTPIQYNAEYHPDTAQR